MGLYTLETRVIYFIIGFVVLILGSCGNVLIVWTLLRTKRLRIVQNIFVGVLAVLDFFITVYLLPFTLISLVKNDNPFSDTTCAVNGAIGHLLFSCDLLLIMCIAVSRYVRICFSHLFDRIYTFQNVLIICAVCFGYWFLTFVPVFTLEQPFIFDKDYHICIFNIEESLSYTTSYMFFALVVPVSVTMLSYVKIYTYVRSSKLKLYKKWNNGLARQRIMHELTITRMQFSIFVAYLILYTPFGIAGLLRTNNTSIPWLCSIGLYFGFINSCINSIIYGFMNRNIRNAYVESLLIFRKKVNAQIQVVPHQLGSNGHLTNTSVV